MAWGWNGRGKVEIRIKSDGEQTGRIKKGTCRDVPYVVEQGIALMARGPARMRGESDDDMRLEPSVRLDEAKDGE